MAFLDEIKSDPLSQDQYVTEETTKTQIYLHHTASSSNPYGVVKWWQSNPDKIAVSFVIGGVPSATSPDHWIDGQILQCFSSKNWAWHLGITFAGITKKPNFKTNKELNANSIGIEICSWGQLTKTDKGWTSYAGVVVPDANIVEYPTPFRGFKVYEKYTDAQIESTRKLILFLCDRWNIPKTFMGMQMFDMDERAFIGTPGIFTHVSVRKDKNDCHPQKELIDMLKSL